MEGEKNVGVDVDFDFVGGKAVVKLKHVGSDGYANLEAGIDAKPFLSKIIDKVEELIPGDQKVYAQLLKDAISKLVL